MPAKDSLREEEREVNHHGSVRSFDADGNEILKDMETKVIYHITF